MAPSSLLPTFNNLNKVPSAPNTPQDEGFQEGSRADLLLKGPLSWPESMREDLAYQLVLSLPMSSISRIHERMTPLLYRDFLTLLPPELSIHVLSFLDIQTILNVAQVSRYCARLVMDNNLWKKLYFRNGWKVNQRMVDWYLSSGELLSTPTPTYEVDQLELVDDGLENVNNDDEFVDDEAVDDEGPVIHWASAQENSIMDNQLQSINNIPTERMSITTIPQQILGNNANLQHPPTPTGPPNFPFAPSAYFPDDLDVHRDMNGRPCINFRHLYRHRLRIEQRWREGRYRIRELSGHSEGIYCIQFDENKVVSGSRDNTIKIWDTRAGYRPIKTYSGHFASVLCLQYDDRNIISGSSDTTIMVWDLYTGGILRVLTGHVESVLNLRFDDTHIVSCSKDRSIKIWDRESGECLRTLFAYDPFKSPNGHRAAVNSVQFVGDSIVSASGDRTIKLWSMKTGECLRTVEGHSRGIACIQFDGRYVVSGSSDKTIKVFDITTGECLSTLDGHGELVRTLQFDDRRIVSGSYDNTVKIWDRETGRLMLDLRNGHSKMVFKLQFNDSKIVSCSQDQKIIIWDFAYDIDTTFF